MSSIHSNLYTGSPLKNQRPKIREKRPAGSVPYGKIFALLVSVILISGCATTYPREGGEIKVTRDESAYTIFNNVDIDHLQKACIDALNRLGMKVEEMIELKPNMIIRSKIEDYNINIELNEIASDKYDMTVKTETGGFINRDQDPLTGVKIIQETALILKEQKLFYD